MIENKLHTSTGLWLRNIWYWNCEYIWTLSRKSRVVLFLINDEKLNEQDREIRKLEMMKRSKHHRRCDAKIWMNEIIRIFKRLFLLHKFKVRKFHKWLQNSYSRYFLCLRSLLRFNACSVSPSHFLLDFRKTERSLAYYVRWGEREKLLSNMFRMRNGEKAKEHVVDYIYVCSE